MNESFRFIRLNINNYVDVTFHMSTNITDFSDRMKSINGFASYASWRFPFVDQVIKFLISSIRRFSEMPQNPGSFLGDIFEKVLQKLLDFYHG